jgi:RNA polymerase sigma-70 factor, ECF subfamily
LEAAAPAWRALVRPALIQVGLCFAADLRMPPQTRIGTGILAMSWNEVEILVENAQMGDRAAYGELVERFQNAVYAVALSRVHDAVEAQELTQEVFVHAMRKLTQLRDPRCFAGWLRQITVRMAINRLTRRGLARSTEPELMETVAANTVGPPEELERAEARRQIHVGLGRLKDLDRQTLEAFYLRGRTLKQMSREFETPVGTIKRRLHVARHRLKEVLSGGTVNERPRRPKARRLELAGV